MVLVRSGRGTEVENLADRNDDSIGGRRAPKRREARVKEMAAKRAIATRNKVKERIRATVPVLCSLLRSSIGAVVGLG